MSTPIEKAFYGWPMFAVFVAGVLISWGVWSFETGAISRVEFDALKTRVAVIESEINNLHLNDNITEIKTDMATLKQASKDMSETVHRIENHQYQGKQ